MRAQRSGLGLAEVVASALVSCIFVGVFLRPAPQPAVVRRTGYPCTRTNMCCFVVGLVSFFKGGAEDEIDVSKAQHLLCCVASGRPWDNIHMPSGNGASPKCPKLILMRPILIDGRTVNPEAYIHPCAILEAKGQLGFAMGTHFDTMILCVQLLGFGKALPPTYVWIKYGETTDMG